MQFSTIRGRVHVGLPPAVRTVAFLGGLTAVLLLGRPALSQEDTPDLKDLDRVLRNAVETQNVARAKEVMDLIAQRGELKGWHMIMQYGLSGVNYEIERHAGKLLASARSKAVHQEVFKQLQKARNFKTRIVLVAVTARLTQSTPAAFEALSRALRDPSRPVVLSVLKQLRAMGQRARPCVEPLIETLKILEKRPKSRIYFDIRKTLQAVTEFDFEVSADWANFWSAYKDGKPLPKKRESGVTVVVRQKFFSVTLDSDRVYFVIDISHSMLIRDPELQIDTSEGGKGRTVVKGGDGPGTVVKEPPPERERLYRVKRELVRLIERLPPHVRFGICAFNHELIFWEGARLLREASSRNKTSAIRWVRGLKAIGYTSTDVALAEALSIMDVDTIFVLTDGAPRDQKNQRIPIDPILKFTKRENRFLRARINTVSFSQIRDSRMKRFVTALARQNDGKETFLD